MPVYNGERFLREAVDSILRQTFSDYEFLIINDGSTDGTAEILRSYSDDRIKPIENDRNYGISYSLNRGITEAQGDYIARMDSDDISLPERFMAQVQFLDDNPSIDAVGCWYEVITQHSQKTGEIHKYLASPMGLRWFTFWGSPVAHPSVMLRRKTFNPARRYDIAEEPAEDYGLWSRINLKVQFANLQAVLLLYRVHAGSISKSQSEHQSEAACVLSQKSISSYLGENIPLEYVRLIKQPHQVQAKTTYNGSILLLYQMYKKFRQDFILSPDEMVDINLDVANKLSQISFENRRILSSRLLRFFAITIVARALVLKFFINRLVVHQ